MRAFAAIKFGLTEHGCLRRADYAAFLAEVLAPEYGEHVF